MINLAVPGTSITSALPRLFENPRIRRQLAFTYGGLSIAAFVEFVIVVVLHRVSGRETSVIEAGWWAVATMAMWGLVVPPLLMTLDRLRQRTTRRPTYVIACCVACIVTLLAVTALRAGIDVIVPAAAREVGGLIQLWRFYLVRWVNPALVFLALIALVHHLTAERPAEVATAADAAEPEPRSFVVRVGSKSVTVPLASVLWIGGEGNYLALHTGSGSYLLRHTMTEIEGQLDPLVWLRVHRSAIVRMESVRAVRREPSGALKAVLAGGREVPVSRLARIALERRLGLRG